MFCLRAVYERIMCIAQDADPTMPGYQASLSYVVLCLLVPIALGALVSVVVTALEKLPAWFHSNR